MDIFRFFLHQDERSEEKPDQVKQGVRSDGRGWTDPDSLIRSEGAKRHFEDVERIFREQEQRREAAAAER